MSRIKLVIKRIVPARAWNRLHLYREAAVNFLTALSDYIYDMATFIKYSGSVAAPKDEIFFRKKLIKDYHVIEKGLSLPEPRPGFGRDIVEQVMVETEFFEARYGPDRFTRAAREALKQYVDLGSRHQLRFSAIDEFLQKGEANGCSGLGGTLHFEKEDLVKPEDISFADFASRRYSVRNFTGEEVPEVALLRAVEISLKTPSVCNRQACKAYILRDRQLIDKALSFQNGNRGFGHKAGALLILTADIRSFMYTGERNQGWIDGGLFAMSIGYAIHSLGYGACMLNWSVDSRKDKAMKSALGIPRYDIVIMMIAVGVIPDQLEVALSLRKDLREAAIVLPLQS